MKKLLFSLSLLFILTSCSGQNFFWSYNNVVKIKYGKLYNWYAVNDSRGIAPSGWHVPTEAECTTLLSNVTSASDLKDSGTEYWSSGGSNSSGFTARGAGARNESTGAFTGLSTVNNIHSSRYYLFEGNPYTAYLNIPSFTTSSGQFLKLGATCRLIKDDSTDPGTVTDYDGNVYTTVKIGTQVWTVENYIVEHYNNGDAISNVTDATAWAALTTGAWCHYDNNPSYQ